MKQELLEKLQKELEIFAGQPDSDEYKNVAEVITIIENLDVSSLEEKAEKFTINGASAWLKLWTNGTKRRVYLNVAYKNGFRPNIKNNFIEF